MGQIAALASTAALLAACGWLAGCAALLPASESAVRSPWRTFDEARTAIERIDSERTTLAELRSAGIDPYASPNIQLLSYSDILLRFPLGGNAASGRLDRGLRECLEVGKACTGYSINVREVKRDHTGPFWLDALGFKRVVETTGWQFNALILMVGDRVVYTLYSGQPRLHEHEVTRHPLGPLQNFGESIPVGNLGR
jgi:hypothetical protein